MGLPWRFIIDQDPQGIMLLILQTPVVTERSDLEAVEGSDLLEPSLLPLKNPNKCRRGGSVPSCCRNCLGRSC